MSCPATASFSSGFETRWALRPLTAANDGLWRAVPLLFVEAGTRCNPAGLRMTRIRRVETPTRADAARLLRELRARGYRALRYQAGRRRAYRVMRLAGLAPAGSRLTDA